MEVAEDGRRKVSYRWRCLPNVGAPCHGDRHAGCHRAEQLSQLMKNIWSSLFLWVSYAAFWKQLQSNHTHWVAAVFGLNPLGKVPKQAVFILPPFWFYLDHFFCSLNFNSLSQRRTIQTFPQRFSIFEYSAFLKKNPCSLTFDLFIAWAILREGVGGWRGLKMLKYWLWSNYPPPLIDPLREIIGIPLVIV